MAHKSMWFQDTETNILALSPVVPNQLAFATDTKRWWITNLAASAWEPAALSPRGAWSSGATYKKSDIVTNAGSAWLALRTSTAVTPVEGLDWTLFASKGDQGDQGDQGDPGVQGNPGTPGAAGANAYTTTSASFTQPAVSSNVTVTVGSTAWMVAGEVLYVNGGGYYTVSSVTDATHVVLTNLGYPGNATPAATVSSPAGVTPGGLQGAAGGSTPTGSAGGDLTGTYPNPTLGAGVVTDAKTAAANKDGTAATASMRTLGTGAQQAAAGNDSRLSDARAPTAHASNHSSGGSDPITHNNLAGLTTGDPHTQYVKKAADTMTGLLTLSGDPSSALHAATKQYVDAVRSGLDPKDSVRAATTANITLSGTQTVDGVALVAGDRILVKDQTTGSQNGIYVVAAGAWSRATDADTSAEVNPGMFTFVEEGTVNDNTGWWLTTNATITLGTTALVFGQFAGPGSIAAGTGLTRTGNVLAADFGSTSGKVTQGNDSRLTDARTPTAHASSHLAGGSDPVSMPAYYKFSRTGSFVSPVTGATWEPVLEARTLNVFAVTVGTAPTASTTILLKRRTSGGTITTIDTLTLGANARDASNTGLSVALAAGDSLRVDVSAGGTAGADMTAVAKAA